MAKSSSINKSPSLSIKTNKTRYKNYKTMRNSLQMTLSTFCVARKCRKPIIFTKIRKLSGNELETVLFKKEIYLQNGYSNYQ